MKRLSCLLSLLLASAAVQAAPPIELFAGMHRIEAEVASSNAERMTGLMNRPSLPAHRGMLFVFPEAGVQCFWMKNTLIPLDMIFADASGTVRRVYSNAVPQDLSVIDGGEGVRYVLEINGGLAKRMGIVEGAQMRASAIAQTDAVWPCSGE